MRTSTHLAIRHVYKPQHNHCHIKIVGTTRWFVFFIYICMSRRVLDLAYIYINIITNGGKFVGGMRFDARLIHASVTASLRGGLSLQTPQLGDHPDQ